MPRTPTSDLAAELRAAVVASGKTQAQLAKETGVSQGRLSEFLAGGNMRLDLASKLCAVLGLTLRK